MNRFGIRKLAKVKNLLSYMVLGLVAFSGAAHADKDIGVQFAVNTNDPTITKDDLVKLNGTTTCYARLTGDTTAAMTVDLSNPDGHLTLSTNQLTLAQDKSWSSFSITGQTGSTAVGDAAIKAVKDGEADSRGTIGVSVFWFNGGSITATAPQDGTGDYALTGGKFAPTGNAITVTAQVTLNPSGLDVIAPQLAPYRLGIEQNSTGMNNSYTMGITNIEWLPGHRPGKRYTFYSQLTVITKSTDASADTTPDPVGEPGIQPFYAAPIPLASTTPTSMAIYDSPQTNVDATTAPFLTFQDPDTNADAAKVTYGTPVLSASFDESFNDWAVLCQVDGTNFSDFNNLAETSWKLVVSSDNNGGKRATGGASGAANDAPVSTPITNLTAGAPSFSQTTTTVTAPQ